MLLLDPTASRIIIIWTKGGNSVVYYPDHGSILHF
jgi:hypothetical protein